MKNLKYNPFLAKSILICAMMALELKAKGEEVGFVQDAAAKAPKDGLGTWNDKEWYKTLGSAKQKSPQLVYDVFADKYNVDKADDIALGFVAKYGNLDMAKCQEIQKKYLKDNSSTVTLYQAGLVLKTHPAHGVLADPQRRVSLIKVEKDPNEV